MIAELRTILCIDDEPDVLSVVKMCLETVGEFNVIAVSSGKEALQCVGDAKPDLILLDVMMPVMDGPATLKEIRKKPELANVPIVFMTARIRSLEVNEYTSMGADGVVAKPFDPMELSNQIRAIWEHFHAH